MKYNINDYKEFKQLFNLVTDADVSSVIGIEFVNKYTNEHSYQAFKKESADTYCLINYKTRQPILNPTYKFTKSELLEAFKNMITTLNCIYLIVE